MTQNFSTKDLSCQVEYPTMVGPASPSTKENIANYGDVESQGGAGAVVVDLIGWSGSEDKNLKKYSDTYLKMGCIVVRYIVPLRVSLFNFDKLPKLAVLAVDILIECQLNAHPMFFHVFSNGGSFVYSGMIQAIGGKQHLGVCEFDIRGTIFDSAATPQSVSIYYRATKAVANYYTFSGLDYIIGWLAFLIMAIRVFCIFLQRAWRFCTKGATFVASELPNKDHLVSSDWITRICKMKRHAFIFLYSEQDSIAPWKKIELVALTLQKRGNPVALVKFEGSDHVLHFKKYPQEYTSAVTKFIGDTMESYQGPTTFWDEYN